MTTRKLSSYDRANRQLNIGLRLLGIWLALVGYFFLRQALGYQGVVQDLAEYQFLHFDRYWPTFTFVALTIGCTAPFIAVLWFIRARQRRNERFGRARVDDQRIMLGRIGRIQSFFGGVAVGCVLCVGVILFQLLTLPSDRFDARSVVIGSPDAVAPADGRAVLTGHVELNETAQFNEDLILVKRTLYFAPVRAGPDDRSPLRYFVQVRRNDVEDDFNPIKFPEGDDRVYGWRFRVKDISFTPVLDGVLVRGALPGEIANLYRIAGYKVDSDNYVLFESNAPIRWRHQMLAGEFLILALIAALVALLFARRRKAVRKLVRSDGPAKDGA